MEAKPVKKKMHLQFFYSMVIASSKLDETGPLYYFEYNFFWLYYNTSLQISIQMKKTTITKGTKRISKLQL